MPEKTSWERFFDAHAAVCEDNVFTKNTVREVDFLIDELRLPPGGSVLDVGCGTGRHAIELAKRGCAVTGVELSAEMLSWAGRVVGAPAARRNAARRASRTRLRPDGTGSALPPGGHVRSEHLGRNRRELGTTALDLDEIEIMIVARVE